MRNRQDDGRRIEKFLLGKKLKIDFVISDRMEINPIDDEINNIHKSDDRKFMMVQQEVANFIDECVMDYMTSSMLIEQIGEGSSSEGDILMYLIDENYISIKEVTDFITSLKEKIR